MEVKPDQGSADRNFFEPLSRREIEILRSIAQGASDREIAEAFFLSLNTIKWHNRQIYSKLGVANRKQAVEFALQAGLLDEARQGLEHSSNVPRKNRIPAQVTSFIGREKEVDQVIQLLTSTRVLTLTGPGGVGKTRLALQTAETIAEAGIFVDGIYFVELAPLSDPSLVAGEILGTLEIKSALDEEPMNSIIGFLQDKQILLILDNFEHLLGAASLPVELLKATTHLKIMVTSRESLQVSGEQVYSVPTLELDSATELFRQRAQAVERSFEVDSANRVSVKQILARLDGLPLAIELAAARVILLSPQALLLQLKKRLDVLKSTLRDVPERQQTVRATLDWSYELLDESEKTLFNRLGVFAGGCSLGAADAVCSDGLSIDPFDGLEALLNKSLISKKDDREGEPHFTMLETLREYALEKLEASGEAEKIRAKHAGYFATFAEQAEPSLKTNSGSILVWTNRIQQTFDNLRAAFHWSMSNDVLPGLRIFSALDGLWWYTNYVREGNRWVEQVSEKMNRAPDMIQARVLIAFSIVALSRGDWELARERILEALPTLRKEQNKSMLAYILGRLGNIDVNCCRFETAEDNLTESLRLYKQLDEIAGIAFALNGFGELMRIQKRYLEAKTFYEESIKFRNKQEGEKGSAALCNLANIERHLGNDDAAYELFVQALEFSVRVNYTFLECAALMGLAGIMAARGNPQLAARLMGSIEATLEINGHNIQPTDQEDYDRSINDARSRLDDETFILLWAEGRTMSLDEAVELALTASG